MTPDIRSTLADGRLHLDGSPFFVVGAELHNSSSSTQNQIRHAFDRAAAVGANTVLAPVSWDQLEPVEGEFDFALIDLMLDTAREKELRLIPLWFGSWKNASSSYAPVWVKTNTVRFPRALTNSPGPVEHVSPFGEEVRRADATAFAALLAHLHAVDSDGTVIMVQVENEVGLLGDSRDRSDLAEKVWSSTIPAEVVDAVASAEGSPSFQAWVATGRRRTGTWSEVVGDTKTGHEVFMAWAYASFVEAVAAAGRAEHNVPLFVNAWLDSEVNLDGAVSLPGAAQAGGVQPGDYPSGGPVTRVAAIWRAFAPTIDFLAPDIYFGNVDDICEGFRAASGYLFIPEMRRSTLGVAHMLRAVGQYHAFGISPFGVDTLQLCSEEEVVLTDGLRLAHATATLVQSAQSKLSQGFILDAAKSASWSGSFGPYHVLAQLRPGADLGYGAVVEERPGVLVVLGRNFEVRFSEREGHRVGILAATQLDFDGEWHVIQRMNGDETQSGSGLRMYGVDRLPFVRFPIPSMTQSTGIIRVELYSF